MEDDGSLGPKFWLGLMGMILGGVIAAVLLFVIFGAAWYAWGFFGTLILFGGILLIWAWIYDRRQTKPKY